MKRVVYSFLQFRVDPARRELCKDGQLLELPTSAFDCLVYLIEHRDRAIGRDELISGVWGRSDVSDSLLAQTLVRIRRTLGDAGNGQHTIRTVTRFGYRWIADIIAEQISEDDFVSSVPVAVASPVAPTSHIIPTNEPAVTELQSPPKENAVSANSQKVSPRFVVLAATVVLLTMLAVSLIDSDLRYAATITKETELHEKAIVVPAVIESNDDSASWLHLGIMNLVTNRLRQGGVPTMNSDSAVFLLERHEWNDVRPGAEKGLPGLVKQRIYLNVSAQGSEWSVKLTSVTDSGTLQTEATDKDAIQAARVATDALLLKWGLHPPKASEAESFDIAHIRQRVEAALLGNQEDVARKLVADAEPRVRESAEAHLLLADVELRTGHQEAAIKEAQQILDSDEGKTPPLRAAALTRMGRAYSNLFQSDKADPLLTEAIQINEHTGKPEELGLALLARGYSNHLAGKYEEALADFTKARVNLEAAGDTQQIANADRQIAGLKFTMGKIEESTTSVHQAERRFTLLGDKQALARCWQLEASIEMQRLDNNAAYEFTERYWPPENYAMSERDIIVLRVVRTQVLIALGRLKDAEAQIPKIRERARPDRDLAALVAADIFDATIASLHDDYQHTIEIARSVITNKRTSHDFIPDAWPVLIRALRASGQSVEANKETQRFVEWSRNLPHSEEETSILVAVLAGEQALANRDTAAAVEYLSSALERAQKSQVPRLIVQASTYYIDALLAANRVEDAQAISGGIAMWADQDFDACWARARVFRASHQSDAYRKSLEVLRKIAGERPMPADLDGQAALPRAAAP